MVRRAHTIAVLLLVALIASCSDLGDAPSPTAEGASCKAADPSSSESQQRNDVPALVTAEELSGKSAGAFGVSGLSPTIMATFPALYRLRNLDKCVVKFTHSVYVPTGWGYSTYSRTGHLLLMGEENGKTIGITTRCALDFTYPGFQYVNPNITNPKFVLGVLALEQSDADGGNVKYDYHIVSEETPTFDSVFTAPNDYFKKNFLGSLGMKPEFWPQVLESGDRVTYRKLGNNDLVFVEFDNLRMLGISSVEVDGGLRISNVVGDSVAFRAGIKVGDVLEDINGVATRKLEDVTTGKMSAPLNKEFTLTVNRNGTRLTRYAVFHHSGNFLSSGSIGSLGIDKPTAVLDELMSSLDQLGALLSTNFYVHCERCHERISRAEVEREPSLLETVARFIPLAGALLSMQPAAVLWTMNFVNRINMVVDVFNWLSDIVGKAQDALAYLRDFPLGKPVRVLASDVRVLDGDTLEMTMPGGDSMQVQPAYCRARGSSGAAYLRTLLEDAAGAGLDLLALPDGKDMHGKTHCHLFLVGESQDDASDRPRLLDVYVNLLLIHEGFASAQDYGVSDGKSTMLVLDGFRKIDKFEK